LEFYSGSLHSESLHDEAIQDFSLTGISRPPRSPVRHSGDPAGHALDGLGYRHTFATDALEAGVPETHVAELLGHSSTAMIFKHYGHLTAKGQSLRKSLDRIRPQG